MKQKPSYLPCICWISRSKHIPALRQAIDEGRDYCPVCVKIAAAEYRARYPKWAGNIFEDGGNDPQRESDSPAMCSRCCAPLACTVIGGARIWTEKQWLKASPGLKAEVSDPRRF